MTWKASRAVYLVDGLRTPFLRAGRQPGPFAAADLAAAAMRALLQRQPPTLRAADIDEVVLGCVLPAMPEVNIARVAMLRAGLDERTPALTVNRVCGSGMQAIDTAARNIAAGTVQLALAGGVESMSHAPLAMHPALAAALQELQQADTPAQRLKVLERLPEEALQAQSGLWCALSDSEVNMRMGDTAEVLARMFSIARADQDAFALASHRRAQHAWEQGHFDAQTFPLQGPDGIVWHRDTGIRADTSAERLAALKPVFDTRDGSVTAGNSSQITDGAAVVLLAGEAALERYGLRPLARISASAWAGLDPRRMGLGPAYAMARLLRDAHLSLRDVDFFEINEAFAAQVLACVRALADDDFCRAELGLPSAAGEIPPDRLNVDGGAIALGHPLGASGARIVLHLAHVLRRAGAARGVAALCIGGGQGGALLLEATEPAT